MSVISGQVSSPVDMSDDNAQQCVSDITLNDKCFVIQDTCMKSNLSINNNCTCAARCKFTAKMQKVFAVDITGRAKCFFRDCTFEDCKSFAVSACSHASVEFTNCVFANNASGIYIDSCAHVMCRNCTFTNNERFAVYARHSAKACFIDCKFDSCDTAVFAIDSSCISITSCASELCRFFTVAVKGSSITMHATSIAKSSSVGVRALDSDIHLTGNTFRECAVCCATSSSAMRLVDNKFVNTKMSCVICAGAAKEQIVERCLFSDNMLHCISLREFAVPTLVKCTFVNNRESVLYVTSFALPTVRDCAFNNCYNVYAVLVGHGLLFAGDIMRKCVDKSTDSVIIDRKHTNLQPAQLCELVSIKCEKEYAQRRVLMARSLFVNIPCGHHTPVTQQLSNRQDLSCATRDSATSACALTSDERREGCADEHVERCSVCQHKVTSVKAVDISSECVLCFDNLPSVMCIPCCHQCMCYACALKNKKLQHKCPCCDQRIASLQFL